MEKSGDSAPGGSMAGLAWDRLGADPAMERFFRHTFGLGFRAARR